MYATRRSLFLFAAGIILIAIYTLVLRGVRESSGSKSGQATALPECLGRLGLTHRGSFQMENALVQAFAFQNDDKVIAATVRIDATDRSQITGHLHVLDLPNLATHASLQTNVLTRCIATSPDGDLLAAGSIVIDPESPQGEVEIWDRDLTEKRQVIPWTPTDPGFDMAIDPNTNRPRATTAAHLAFDLTSKVLYAFGASGFEMCRVAEVERPTPSIEWRQCPVRSEHKAVDQRNQRLALLLGRVRVFDLDMANEELVLIQQYPPGTEFFWGEPGIEIVAWSPAGAFLFAQSVKPYDLSVWDMTNGTAIFRDVRSIEWGPRASPWVSGGAIREDGAILAIAIGEGSNEMAARPIANEIRLYDIENKCLAHIERLAAPVAVRSLHFSPDGKYLLLHEGYHLATVPIPKTETPHPAWSKKSQLSLYEVREGLPSSENGDKSK